MLFKNLPRQQFKRIFLARLILDGVAAMKFVAGLHFTGFWSVVKAHYFFYTNLSSLLKKRKKVQKLVSTTEHKEIYPRSIMWKFFIENKKKFSDLNFNP